MTDIGDGTTKVSARQDDALKHATEGMMRSGRDTRAEEWHSAEPSGEDQPDVDRNPEGTMSGGLPEGMTGADVEDRTEIARFLDRTAFPAVVELLMDNARANQAPDHVLDLLRRAPSGREYASVGEVVRAIGDRTEEHRF